MNGEELLKIVGEIDDKYLRECEEYEFNNKKSIFAVKRYVAIAASICFIVAAIVAVVCINKMGGDHSDIPAQNSMLISGPFKDIVYHDFKWEDEQVAGDLENVEGSDLTDIDDIQYWAIVKTYCVSAAEPVSGYVCITKQLKDLCTHIWDKDMLIAVYVDEQTMVSATRVYEEFVKPLNVPEDYMEKGVIYISFKQLAELSCPRDMKIVLSLSK